MDGIFTFIGHTLDVDSGVATFSYEVSHQDQTYEFIEELRFPIENIDLQKVHAALLQKTMDNLLLILGVSYYKLFCPKTIKSSVKLTEKQAIFWNTVYTKGLGEFFYKNGLEYHDLIHFPFSKNASSSAVTTTQTERSLLLFAGGKDSIVSAELLKKENKQFSTLTINPTYIHYQTLEVLKTDSIFIERILDAQLLELNKEGIGYNGHIPATAINDFIGLFAAALYDYKYVIGSNEESSNYGNIEYLGEEINHQWSKSFAFEKLLQAYASDYITPNITYFSLLRAFSELKITEIFSHFPDYFSSFSSCNRNFVLQRPINGIPSNHWCGQCPKCLFVFILLSAFLDKKTVRGIFGKNLFEDQKLLEIFKQLLGVASFKPFECVGTPDETKAALWKVYHKDEYVEGALLDYFEKEILPHMKKPEELFRQLLVTKKEHAIPQEFSHVITNETF